MDPKQRVPSSNLNPGAPSYSTPALFRQEAVKRVQEQALAERESLENLHNYRFRGDLLSEWHKKKLEEVVQRNARALYLMFVKGRGERESVGLQDALVVYEQARVGLSGAPLTLAQRGILVKFLGEGMSFSFSSEDIVAARREALPTADEDPRGGASGSHGNSSSSSRTSSSSPSISYPSASAEGKLDSDLESLVASMMRVTPPASPSSILPLEGGGGPLPLVPIPSAYDIISSEREMLEALVVGFLGDQRGPIELGTLQQHLLELTGTPWAPSFSNKFGDLLAFLKSIVVVTPARASSTSPHRLLGGAKSSGGGGGGSSAGGCGGTILIFKERWIILSSLRDSLRVELFEEGGRAQRHEELRRLDESTREGGPLGPVVDDFAFMNGSCSPPHPPSIDEFAFLNDGPAPPRLPPPLPPRRVITGLPTTAASSSSLPLTVSSFSSSLPSSSSSSGPLMGQHSRETSDPFRVVTYGGRSAEQKRPSLESASYSLPSSAAVVVLPPAPSPSPPRQQHLRHVTGEVFSFGGGGSSPPPPPRPPPPSTMTAFSAPSHVAQGTGSSLGAFFDNSYTSGYVPPSGRTGYSHHASMSSSHGVGATAPYSAPPYAPPYPIPAPYGSSMTYSSSHHHQQLQQQQRRPPPAPRFDASFRVDDWDAFDRLCRPLFLGGFPLVKHGRDGLARERRFWLSPSLKMLCWESSKLLSLLNSNVDSLAIAEVIEVTEDLGPGLGAGRNSCCMTLLTRKRTLSLEASFSEQGFLIMRGLQFLCSHPHRTY